MCDLLTWLVPENSEFRWKKQVGQYNEEQIDRRGFQRRSSGKTRMMSPKTCNNHKLTPRAKAKCFQVTYPQRIFYGRRQNAHVGERH
jgi:hypothetical protein